MTSPGHPPLIAIVEDEEHLAEGLIFNLEAEGFRTHHELDGDSALAWLLAPENHPAAVILDIMLPGRDGFSITRSLREAQRFTPILLLTARGRTEDILEGFAAGADDYLPKPFDLNVLLARLHGLLRRTAWQASAGTSTSSTQLPASNAPDAAEQVTLGDRLIDFNALEIRAIDDAAAPIRLTVMEADLLRYLLAHPGRVVSRKEILEEVWRVQADTDTRPIDNFMVRLRRYLEPDPTNPVYFLTARGVGYRFAGSAGLKEPLP